MTVDGVYTEKWMTTGSFDMLASTKAFIGGSEAPYKLPGKNGRYNFVGCLKKVGVNSRKDFLFTHATSLTLQVEFTADSLHLPLLRFAEEGNDLMNIVGDVDFQCKPALPIQPVAFTSGDAYLVSCYFSQHFVH